MRYPSVTITLAMLEALFSNPALCAEFPFIGFAHRTWSNSSLAPRPNAGCGHCRGGGAAGREYRQHLLETVKASLLGLQPDRIKRFKDLLNTDKLVLHFSVRGQTVTKEM